MLSACQVPAAAWEAPSPEILIQPRHRTGFSTGSAKGDRDRKKPRGQEGSGPVGAGRAQDGGGGGGGRAAPGTRWPHSLSQLWRGLAGVAQPPHVTRIHGCTHQRAPRAPLSCLPPIFLRCCWPSRGKCLVGPAPPCLSYPPTSKAPEVTGGGSGEPTGVRGTRGALLRACSLSSPATKGRPSPIHLVPVAALCRDPGSEGPTSTPPSSDSRPWGPPCPPLLDSPSSLTPVSPLPGSSLPLPLLSTLGVPEAWLFLPHTGGSCLWDLGASVPPRALAPAGFVLFCLAGPRISGFGRD